MKKPRKTHYVRVTLTFGSARDAAFHQSFLQWLDAEKGQRFGSWVVEQERRYYQEHRHAESPLPPE